MNVIFTVSRLGRAADFLEKLAKRPEIYFDVQKIGINEFLFAELSIPKNVNENYCSSIERKAMKKLDNMGVKKILAGKGVNRSIAEQAGIAVQSGRKAVKAAGKKIVLKVLKEHIMNTKSLNCIFYSRRINDDIIEIIESVTAMSRYISVECGDYSDEIQDSLLSKYGISKQNIFGEGNKLLILFSNIEKSKLWKIAPSVIINLSGEEILLEGTKIISNAEFILPCEYRRFAEAGANQSEIVSTLLECGALTADKINIQDVIYSQK